MDFVACIIEQVDRLVHPAVLTKPVERAQHRTFIATRLTVSIGAVALLPFYLAGGGIPGWVDALVLAWLVLPLLAAAHVAHSGRLLQGEILSVAAWIGLALSLYFGRVSGLGPSFAILCMVVLEANFFEQFKNGRIAILAGLAASLAMLAAAVFGLVPQQAMGAQDPALYVLAALYGAALSFQGARARNIKHAIQGDDARRYRVLSEAIGDMVLRFDRAGSVLLASESAERLFGLKTPDVIGRGFFERLHVADRPTFLKIVSDAANGRETATGTMRLRLSSVPSADGRYIEPIFAWVELRTSRLDEGPNASVGAVTGVVRDITNRMKREAEIEGAKRDAEQASALKDQFLASVTHELRTPLNAIIGFGEMLASETHSPTDATKRREYAAIIHQSGQHLLSVVNSLLDLSKIDAGKFDLIFEPFDLGTLVGSCCDMVGLKAETKQINLVRDFGPVREIVADKRACRQILINLLSNALKFTPEQGTVAVSLESRGDQVEIVVSDTGIGIRPSDMPRLGDPFFQAHNGYDRAFEGTGLGLSVVSGLVSLHGGTIAVESLPGEGTRISVRLPRNGEVQKPRAEKPRIEVISRRPRPISPTAAPSQVKVSKIA